MLETQSTSLEVEEAADSATDQEILKSIEQIYYEDGNFDPARYELRVYDFAKYYFNSLF